MVTTAKKKRGSFGGGQRPLPDFASVVLAFLWGALMVLLWPHGPIDQRGDYRYQSMVVADDKPFPRDKLYLRPDLIALPSAVSFSPPPDNDPPLMNLGRTLSDKPDLLEPRIGEGKSGTSRGVALAAEAIMSITDDDLCRVGFSSANKPRIVPGPDAGLLAEISGGLSIKLTASDRVALASGKRAWDVLLSLTLDEYRDPENIFIEKSSGYKDIDREVMRALSQAENWHDIRPGDVCVEVSYTPIVKNGAGNDS